MLTPERNVPHTLTEVIAGADGGQVVGAMTEEADTANVCVQDKTRASMACAAMNLAGWTALRDLAEEMMRRLAPKDANGPDH